MTRSSLCAWANHHNFPAGPLSLADALARSGFVQADPIRSPARAQDLILRQRVQGYRVGDLEASYEALDLEEDFLYAYGYLTRETWRHLHPRRKIALKALERRVLDVVIDMGEAHPADVAARLGAGRAVNAWGGYSNASTRALHHLHWHGLLRVSRRERGIRVYEPPIDNIAITRPEAARIQQVVLLVARILAPVPERSLVQTLGMLGHYCHLPPGKSRLAIGELVKRGQLVSEKVDGVPYLWPSNLFDARTPEPPERVRILAPFDPLVWDRRRFEHLWGWKYRFEAYTPAAKRTMGYYAMPLLWRDRVIGWVNASAGPAGLVAEPGFISGRAPRERSFLRAYEEEVADLGRSLDLTGAI